MKVQPGLIKDWRPCHLYRHLLCKTWRHPCWLPLSTLSVPSTLQPKMTCSVKSKKVLSFSILCLLPWRGLQPVATGKTPSSPLTLSTVPPHWEDAPVILSQLGWPTSAFTSESGLHKPDCEQQSRGRPSFKQSFIVPWNNNIFLKR